MADLTSPSLHKYDDTVPNTLPSGSSSLPHVLTNSNKEWLVDIWEVLHLLLVGIFNTFDAVLNFLLGAMFSGSISPYYF